MVEQKRFLVDVGIRGIPFPIRAASRLQPEGQHTIARISINARIMQEFEARSIDRLIQVLHKHRDRIGTHTLRVNIMDYVNELQATAVHVDFEYPFFFERLTPVSSEKCLVRYACKYSAKYPSIKGQPRILFSIEVPSITTYPASFIQKSKGLFGQLSIVTLEIESHEEIFPEDLLEIVDRHALMPVYSFLTEEDQIYAIEKIHTEKKSSVVMVDEIRHELAQNRTIEWFSVSCSNFGMLHSYSTVIGIEKSMWVPMSGYEEYEI
jgi:GTP cyclohydrolase I